MSANGTYVYCLVAADRKPSLSRRRPQLPGMGPLRLLDVGRARQSAGRWLVVADAPRSRFSAKAINEKLGDLNWVSRAAIAHEAVVESFKAARAVVPMKFLTIFSSDERAMAEIATNGRRVDEAIKRVTGRDEWGVRVTLDRARVAETARRGRPSRASLETTGSSYLRRKKAARDRDVELAARAREVVGALYDRLAPRASEARRRTGSDLPIADGPLLLDAAFLVPRTRTKAFHALVAREARALAPQGYRVAMTGPWPPYTFVKD